MTLGQTFPLPADSSRAFSTHAEALAFYRQCQREGRIAMLTSPPFPQVKGAKWVVDYSRDNSPEEVRRDQVFFGI